MISPGLHVQYKVLIKHNSVLWHNPFVSKLSPSVSLISQDCKNSCRKEGKKTFKAICRVYLRPSNLDPEEFSSSLISFLRNPTLMEINMTKIIQGQDLGFKGCYLMCLS